MIAPDWKSNAMNKAQPVIQLVLSNYKLSEDVSGCSGPQLMQVYLQGESDSPLSETDLPPNTLFLRAQPLKVCFVNSVRD